MLSLPRSLASGIREMHPVRVCPVIPGEVFVFFCGSSEGGKGVQVLAGGEKGHPDPQLDTGTICMCNPLSFIIY